MKPTYPAEGDGVTERLACCIPHCRRTFRNDKKLTPWPEGTWVMCGKHWRSAPRDLILRERRLRRTLRRIRTLKDQKRREGLENVVWRWLDALWNKIRTAATERAMGIG